jgi:hypothetical protein
MISATKAINFHGREKQFPNCAENVPSFDEDFKLIKIRKNDGP